MLKYKVFFFEEVYEFSCLHFLIRYFSVQIKVVGPWQEALAKRN